MCETNERFFIFPLCTVYLTISYILSLIIFLKLSFQLSYCICSNNIRNKAYYNSLITGFVVFSRSTWCSVSNMIIEPIVIQNCTLNCSQYLYNVLCLTLILSNIKIWNILYWCNFIRLCWFKYFFYVVFRWLPSLS